MRRESLEVQIADRDDIRDLMEDAAEMLGLETSVLNAYIQLFRSAPVGPQSLDKASDLRGLVRDLLIKTVGMGIELN